MPYKHPARIYAERHSRSTVTIRRWQKEGAPLDDPERMPGWVASVEARNKSASSARGNLDVESVETGAGVGAAAALSRLEQEERAAHSALQGAKRTKDSRLIRDAQRTYTEVNRALLSYDREIEASRRSTGELIPRSDAEAAIEAASRAIRLAVIRAAQSDLDVVVEAARLDPVVAARRWLDCIRRHAPDCVRLVGETTSPAPPWSVAPVMRGLDLD